MGRSNQSPILNIFNIATGGAVLTEPTKNFARYLLMCLILFSLVVRTLYQGELFNNMQSDIMKSPVSTVAEMMEENFKFYLSSNTMVHANSTVIKKRAIVIPSNQLENYSKLLQNTDFRGTVSTSLDDVIIWNKRTYPYQMTEVCKEYIFVNRLGIYFQKNSHLVDQVNNIIEAFQTNGLVGYWQKNLLDLRYLIRPPPSKIAKKLDIIQFMGAFYVFFMGLLISLIFFVVEYLSLKLKFLRNIFSWLQDAN